MQRTTTAWRAFVALVFVMVLAACGGGGGGDSGGAPAPQGSKLFVSDGGNHAIGSQINANPGAGTSTVDRIISGPATGLGSGGTPSPSTIPSIALDISADQLYAATQTRLLVFNQASFAAGNVAPARTIISSVVKNTVLSGVNFFQLFLDTGNNRLYVAEPDGFVHAFDNASGLTGAVAPSRSIQTDLGGSATFQSIGIAVDTAANNLFVGLAGSGFTNILIFNTQSGKSGLTPPDQTLSFSTAPTSFYLDRGNNRLYVAVFGGNIQVFNNANSLTTGTPAVARLIPLSTVSTSSKFIFLDTTNDRLYAVANNQVFIVQSASTVKGVPFTVTQVTLSDANARFSSVIAKP